MKFIGADIFNQNATFSGNLLIKDFPSQIKVGTGGDLQIYHDGSDSWIENTTSGDLYISNNGNGKDVVIVCDDGTGGTTPYITLDGSATSVSIYKAVAMSSTLTVASDIIHASDADTKISFTPDTITFIAGGTSAVQSTARGATILKRHFAIPDTPVGTADGDVVYFGNTTSMTIGRVYYMKSDGTWELTNPNAVGTSTGMLAVALGEASNTNGMLIRGMVTLDHDPGTIGDILYLDEQQVNSAFGAVTNGAPAGTGDVVRIIGYCLDSSGKQIYFNPDSNHTVV
tara:strand:+ start:1638 stop:2492 length:855 start_codon:yes stop_codon:yes gene_type:complete